MRLAESQAPAAQAEGALRLYFGVHSDPLLCAPVGMAPNRSAGGGASSADERDTLPDAIPRATVRQTGRRAVLPLQGTGAAKSPSDI